MVIKLKKTKKKKNTIKHKNKNKTIKNFEEIILYKDKKKIDYNYNYCIDNIHDYTKEIYKTNLSKLDIDFKNNYNIMNKDISSKMYLEDFYTFINSDWLNKQKGLFNKKNINHNTYLTQFDDFRFKQIDIFKTINKLVDSYIKKYSTRKKAYLIKNVKESFILGLSKNKILTKLNDYILKINNFFMDKDGGVWKILGELSKNDLLSSYLPFSFLVQQDLLNHKKYIINISPIQPTLDILSYFDTNNFDTNKNMLLYKKLIIDLFDKYFGKDYKINPNDIIDFEKDMLYSYGGCKQKKYMNDNEKVIYIKTSESLDKYGFDFNKMAQQYGFKNINKFNVSNLEYLQCGTKVYLDYFKNKTNVLKQYFIFIFLKQIERYSGITNKNLMSDFFKKIEGLKNEYAREFFQITGYMTCFNDLISKLYINFYSKNNDINKTIEYVSNLKNNLVAIQKNIIKNNKWLDNSTKNKALLKLDKLKIIIGNPLELRKDPLLNYVNDDCWYNMEIMHKWKAKKFTELIHEENIGLDIPALDYHNYPTKPTSEQCYIVNAFYNPLKNSIYVPLAYLNKPFIDIKSSIEYNISYIGYTLGHEISHAFDDNGSKYDENGEYRNWWTEKDKKYYKKIQKNILNKYKISMEKDNIDTSNIAMTLGESLADISGLNICTYFLLFYYNKNNIPIELVSIYLQKFFIMFAIQYRSFSPQLSIRYLLNINPHPFAKYRVNVPLSYNNVFKLLYNINKNSLLYDDKNDFW